jgi:hypothetical protein
LYDPAAHGGQSMMGNWIVARRKNTRNVARAVLSAFLILTPIAHSQTSDDGVYAPAAKAVIRVDGDKLEASLQILARFANDKRAKFSSGDFPKQGRRVANVMVRFSKNTFFAANNFLSEDELNVTAYSHDQFDVWLPNWGVMIDALRAGLGRGNVSVVMEPSDDGAKR